jgi:ApaG protein
VLESSLGAPHAALRGTCAHAVRCETGPMPHTDHPVLLIVGLIAVIAAQMFATTLREVGRAYVDLVVEGRMPYRPPSPSPPNPRRPPFVELQPDEVRQLAPLATAEHMKCGTAIPPESITRTRHGPLASVTIFVKSAYTVREEVDGLHQFSYTVEIANDGEATLQLMTRHWVFTDERGHVEEAKGPGARGQMALIQPGDKLQYSSSTYLATTRGSMHGSFQFEELSETDDEGLPLGLKGYTHRSVSAFNGRVSRLALSQGGRAEKVPCIEDHGKLPMTGVGTAHRLGAGITVSYEPGRSDPDLGRYSFSYSVTVSNSRPGAVAVVGHDWTFTDALGVQRHERGEGLGGEHGVGKVRLDSQRALNYQGRFELPTRTGNVVGQLIVSLSQHDEALYHVPINALGVSADGKPVALIQPLTFLAGVGGGSSFLDAAPPPLAAMLAAQAQAERQTSLLSSSYVDAQLASTDPGPSKDYYYEDTIDVDVGPGPSKDYGDDDDDDDGDVEHADIF